MVNEIFTICRIEKTALISYTGHIMIIPPVQKNAVLAALFGLLFVVFGWFSFSLALSGLFLFPIIAIGFVGFVLLAIGIAWKLLKIAPLDLRLVFLIALLYALLIGGVSEPTLFSGRDQGSIAEAAYRLAQNTELAFSTPASNSFFQIYGPGTALNFPGFAYTKDGYLLTQFPIGYTAWLGSFVSLFSTAGFAIANSLLLFLFLFFFYQLMRLFVQPAYAGASLLLALTSFLPSWYAKMALTENMALFLFVFLLYNIILFFQEAKFLYYAGILLSGGLLAFTRIEGFAFLLLTAALMAWHPHTHRLVRTYPWKSLVAPGLLFGLFFLRDFFINLPYYTMIGRALSKFLHGFTDSTLGVIERQTASFGLGSVFFLYGLLVLFLLGLFGLILFLKAKRPILLIPAFIALPTLLYLFFPNITPDYPWLLRRYLFSLFPVLLFSATLALALLFATDRSFPLALPTGKRRVLVGALFTGLCLLQFPAWYHQLFYAENRGLRDQIANFSQAFSDRDLILVDQNATGDGYAMLSGPGQFLYGKNTVYFFNPYDLAVLDTTRYEHIYLLTPEESQSRYATVFGEHLVFKQFITFTLNHWENLSLKQSSPVRLPAVVNTETRNVLFQIY